MKDTEQQDKSECRRPCEPPGCDECADYWKRMEREGYWKNGRWTEKGWRQIIK